MTRPRVSTSAGRRRRGGHLSSHANRHADRGKRTVAAGGL